MATDVSKYAVGNSKWLKAADLEAEHDGPVTVTISEVSEETIKTDDGMEDKLAVSFKGIEKPLLLNVTNTRTLIKLFTSDAEEWVDRNVKLYVTLVNNPRGGEQVKSIAIGEAPKRTIAKPTAALVGAGASGKRNAFEGE